MEAVAKNAVAGLDDRHDRAVATAGGREFFGKNAGRGKYPAFPKKGCRPGRS